MFTSHIVYMFRFFGQCLSIIIVLIGTLHAKTEVFFSPNGLIRNNIIKTIHNSEKSIDIAMHIFSSGEIAEALYEAKARGVKVRVILDYKQKQNYHPVVEFLQDEAFSLQFLKGTIGGSMNNSFAIFDSKIVVSGSYHWSAYSEKFNYENALFIDDIDVIRKFQDEFEFLYEKCITKRVPQLESSVPPGVNSGTETEIGSDEKLHTSLSDNRKLEEREQGNTGGLLDGSPKIPLQREYAHKNILKDGKRIDGAVLDKSIPKTKGGNNSFSTNVQRGESGNVIKDEPTPIELDISFQEFDKLFGRRGTLGRAERKRVWKDQFEGKYVRWSGEIGYKGIAVYDWNKIGIRNKDNSIDIELRVDWANKHKLKNLVMGDVITFRGKLVSPGGFMAPYKLVDVDILNVQ